MICSHAKDFLITQWDAFWLTQIIATTVTLWLSSHLSSMENMHQLTWKILALAATCVHLCNSKEVGSLFLSDKITKLPGQPEVNFQQYSGYITVDERNQRALFYYFVEAETDPSSKPLVLWLTGGPGCSSLGSGAFRGNGPFRPSGSVLIKNEYSWNTEANILYVETPAGVGFSYSTNRSFYKGLDDNITARDNLVFLQRWLEKFLQYKNRDLFLTGESYAGHYIPQLAQLMVQSNKREKIFNIKGVALGNPLLDFNTDFNSRAEFLWSHGVISDSTYSAFTSRCNYSQYIRERQKGALTLVCAEVISQVNREISHFVDTFDVTLDVCKPLEFLLSQVLTSQQEGVDVCSGYETTDYLNRKDVQDALHAHLIKGTKWAICTSVLQYNQLNLEIPMTTIVQSLVESGIPVLVYSGDQDSVIPLTGTRTLVQRMADELRLNTTIDYRVWFEGKQVGGWTQVYGNIFTFVTIRGASHEPPVTQPKRTLVMFKAFLEGKPLPEKF